METHKQGEAQVRMSITFIVTKTPRTTQFQLPHSSLLRTVAVLRQKSEYPTQWLRQRCLWPRNQCSITSKRKRYLSVLQSVQPNSRAPQLPIQWVPGTLAQGVTRPSRNPNRSSPSNSFLFHHRVFECPPPVPILSQINPAQEPPPFPLHFLKKTF